MKIRVEFEIELDETFEHIQEFIEEELNVRYHNMEENPLEFATIKPTENTLKITKLS